MESCAKKRKKEKNHNNQINMVVHLRILSVFSPTSGSQASRVVRQHQSPPASADVCISADSKAENICHTQ